MNSGSADLLVIDSAGHGLPAADAQRADPPGGQLQDDASIVVLEWHTGDEERFGGP